MSADFVDTNVLVYAYDHDEPEKRRQAKDLLRRIGRRGQLVISTQVLKEFYVSVTRKLRRPLSASDALEALEAWAALPTVQIDFPLIRAAAVTSHRHQLSFWDSLILESAALRGCKHVFSEDLQDGFEHKGLTVKNPFQK